MGTTTPVQAHELVSDIEYSDAGDLLFNALKYRVLRNARRPDGDGFAGHREERQGS